MFARKRDGSVFAAHRNPGAPGCGVYRHFLKLIDILNAAIYYVFVEEEDNGSRHGENEKGLQVADSQPFGKVSL